MTSTKTLNLVIVIEPATFRVLWVSITGFVPNIYRIAGTHILRGDAAHWLYVALTGHRIDEHPDQGNTMYAHSARAMLMQVGDSNHDDPGAYTLARRVVQNWGGYIRPWLGIHYYDSRTGIIQDHPDYHVLIDLHTGERIQIDTHRIEEVWRQ